MLKPNAGSIPLLPIVDLESTTAWDHKKINSWPQSCLCLTCSGPFHNNDDKHPCVNFVNFVSQYFISKTSYSH